MLRAPAVRTVLQVLLFLAGTGVLIWLINQLDIAEILRLVARTGWHLGLVLLVYGGCQAARAAALWLCQPQEDMASYRDVLAVRMSAEAVRLLTFTGPLLAEPSKVWLLGKRGLHAREGIAAIIAEIVTHSVIATILSIAALGYLLVGFEVSPFVRTAVIVLLSAMGVYVVGALTVIVLRLYLIGGALKLLAPLGLFGFARDGREVRKMEDLIYRVLSERPARLILILVFQLAANVCLMLEVLVALRGMGFDVPAAYPLMIEGSIKFVSVAFFFIPTQVGVSEGTYALLFDTIGLGAAAGVSLAFIRRLRTLAVAAIGLVIIAVLGLRQGSPGDRGQP